MSLTRKLTLVAIALVLVAGCNAKAKEEPKKTDDAAKTAAPAAEVKPAAAPAAETKPAEVAKPAEPNKAEIEKLQKVSYAIGYLYGSGFKRDGANIQVDDFTKGLTAGMTGATPTMTEDDMRTLLMAYGQELRAKAMEKARIQGEESLKKGKIFLAENAKKEGVKTTASGLQYKVITEGKGAIPTANDTVKVNYKGTLLDGTEFDSSYKRGEPAEFAVNRVIPGWTEAMQLMKVGSKYQLFIPANLAYGEAGQGPIGPNEVLIFEVELLDIVKPEAAPAAATMPKVDIKPAEAPKK